MGEEIINIVANVGPAITAITSIIVAVIVGVNKVKSVSKSGETEIKRANTKITNVEGYVYNLDKKLDNVLNALETCEQENKLLRKEVELQNGQIKELNQNIAKDRQEIGALRNQVKNKMKGE